MTSLKCLNSGVESNGAAFILSPSVSGFSCRVPGAYGKEGSSSSLLHLAGEFFIRHAASHNLFHDGGKTLRIRSLPVVIAKSLFVKITEQVKRFHADVGSVQATLQETPKVLHCVRVHVAIYVFNGMVDDGVLVVVRQAIVGKQFVREDSGTSIYALANRALKLLLLAVLDVVYNNLATTLDHSEYDLLTFWPASLNHFRSLGFMHVAGLAADERLINFNLASELIKTLVLHCQTNPVKHKPCGLLGNTKTSMDLVGTDSILASDEHPCRTKPLLKWDRRIFKNRTSLQGKRRTLMPRVAFPYTRPGKPSQLSRTAVRAGDLAVRPAQFNHELSAMLKVREPQNRVSQRIGAFHGSSMHPILWNVKYVITLRIFRELPAPCSAQQCAAMAAIAFASCYDKPMRPDPAKLRDFAVRYTSAWCSQDAASIAAFYSPGGFLTVNNGSAAVGRREIREVAQSFMTAFPDLQVVMDDLVMRVDGAAYHWTLIGTNSGPGGTGNRVQISGFEVWTVGSDGLIASSRGHFDASDYRRQLISERR
jgi:hypothetical protein